MIDHNGVLYEINPHLEDGDIRELQDGVLSCNQKTFEAIKRSGKGQDTAFAPILDLKRNKAGVFELGSSEDDRLEAYDRGN